ncbi:hypothetical protein FRC08_006733 [Ceratobasidium sp. 394]|nr:hypothetical protein FRC08_006733 [Ceratobasidium sp. 394]KAG9098075.1 hypothetical protein FS749_004752 [Ceratobasidium sp. UAMH 11750]
MFPRTLNVSETLRKLRGWSIAPLKCEETPVPRRTSHRGAPVTVPGTQIDRDVLLNISEHLFTPGDRLALAMTSRWHYSALIRVVYTYINLSQGIKVASLVEQLLGNEVLCSGVHHVDIVFPPAYRSSHRDIAKSTAYYSQRQKFVEGTFVVLKLATRLKTLSMHHFTGDSYAQLDLLGEGLHDIYPFNLKHLSAQTVPGTLSFVERQTQLEHLVLFPVIEYTSTPRPSVSPISLPRLHTLWAPPGGLASYSLIHQFVPLDCYLKTRIRRNLMPGVEFSST